MQDKRETARQLANDALADGRPTAWFETLYALADSGKAAIPWADNQPNPNLVVLYERTRNLCQAGNVLIVGCGYGDDAEWFAAQGYKVTAFDISASAITGCRRRFPSSGVDYVAADLFEASAAWHGAFDLVAEAYTLQVLPAELRERALSQIAGFVRSQGCLLLVTRARATADPTGNMPWPLTLEEVERVKQCGFVQEYFEDYLDNEEPCVRRFRACYRREG